MISAYYRAFSAASFPEEKCNCFACPKRIFSRHVDNVNECLHNVLYYIKEFPNRGGSAHWIHSSPRDGRPMIGEGARLPTRAHAEQKEAGGLAFYTDPPTIPI
ncbi:uncharacterized protein VTP21DRAFT_11221 [Calcarisporiella thermophila]|uniref:uncharacterized protein n=1 Tax=Calcarisporiella thermophila TaxID=911321 RepID=UPI003743CDE4